MASTVANLLTSMVGNVVKPQPVTPIAQGDDGFARMLDAAANATARNETAPAQQATTSETKPASDDAAPKTEATDSKASETTETAKAGETAETKTDDDKDTGTGENSLAESLLAALAALGLNTEQVGQVAATTDTAALGEVEGALNDLAKQLGMDLKTLMQQLAELAKGVAAAGGGKDDLAAKLKAFVGDKLGAAGVDLDPGIQESFAKLLGGLEKLAKPIPTEPELATPELKLNEPILTGKATAADEKPAVAELAPETKSERSERKVEAKPADAAPAAQDKPAATQAARQNAPQDNAVAANAAGPAQAQNDPATQPVNAATTPRVVQTGYQTSQQQLNLPQIAFEVSRQVESGNSRFQIRLDPPELGRIDVKLDIDNKGQVHAKLTVEKAETLDLMQRDQRALEKALQQAGLDQSKTNLEFSLKQNPFAGDQNQRSDSEHGGFGGGQDGQEETEVAAPPITLYRGALQASGVNIIA